MCNGHNLWQLKEFFFCCCWHTSPLKFDWFRVVALCNLDAFQMNIAYLQLLWFKHLPVASSMIPNYGLFFSPTLLFVSPLLSVWNSISPVKGFEVDRFYHWYCLLQILTTNQHEGQGTRQDSECSMVTTSSTSYTPGSRNSCPTAWCIIQYLILIGALCSQLRRAWLGYAACCLCSQWTKVFHLWFAVNLATITFLIVLNIAWYLHFQVSQSSVGQQWNYCWRLWWWSYSNLQHTETFGWW